MKIATTKIKCSAAFLAFAASCLYASALEVKEGLIKNKSIFGISFPNETSLYITSTLLSSISKQDYISAATNVHEIVIDTLGGTSQIRIYHIRPLNAADMAREAAGKTPGRLKNTSSMTDRLENAKNIIQDHAKIEEPTTDIVYKQYPNTTHSKTIEFAVDSLEEFEDLYAALVKDFAGTTVIAKSKSKQERENADLPERNIMGGKLYQLEGAKALKEKNK